MQKTQLFSGVTDCAVTGRSIQAKIRPVARAVVLAFGLALLAGTANAANWYVRPSAAGSGNGTDWNNAWSLSGIGWSSVQPGDTIWLAGGTYSATLNPQKSGTASAWISIKRVRSTDSAPAAAAGWNSSFDSQVIIAPGGSSPISWSGSSAGNYVSIDGRVDSGIVAKLPNIGSLMAGCVYFGAPGNYNHIQLMNIDMSGPGNNPVGDFAALNVYAWTGSGYASVSDVLVSKCRLHGTPNLVRFFSARGFVFDGCQFYDNVSNNSGIHANMIYYHASSSNTWRNCDFSGWQVEGFAVDSSGPDSPLYIYGNTFHDRQSSGARCFWFCYPEGSAATPQGPVYLYNNTFVGVDITINEGRSVAPAAGSMARNNIYWNSTFSGPGQFSDSDYNFSNGSIPGSHSISSGANPFVNEAANDFRLTSGTGANLPRNKGVSLSAPFNVSDPAGISRGSDGSWDIGAFEFGSAAPPTNPVISLNPGSVDFGVIAVGTTTNQTFTIRNIGAGTLSGTVSASAPFSVVSGGTYNLTSNQSQTVTLRYTPTASGNHSQTINFTSGGGASLPLAGSAYTILPGLTFSATSGLLSGPFVSSGGMISQPSETSLAGGGRAVYAFTVTTPGDYVIEALTLAPSAAENSVFVNIDSEPIDPQSIWHVPVSTTVQSYQVSWQGNGTFDNPELAPKVFTLSAGVHQLIIRGREPNTQIQQVSIVRNASAPLAAPTNLRLISGQ